MVRRGFLFLFSLVVVIAATAALVWLFATHEAATIDGLFLVTASLVAILAFGLYLRFMIREAIREMSQESGEPAPAPAAARQRAVAVQTERHPTGVGAR